MECTGGVLWSLADRYHADAKDLESFFGDLAGLHERTKRYDTETTWFVRWRGGAFL